MTRARLDADKIAKVFHDFCNKKHCGYWDICRKGDWANLLPYTKVFNANSRKGKVS